jgi:hypothetical protein
VASRLFSGRLETEWGFVRASYVLRPFTSRLLPSDGLLGSYAPEQTFNDAGQKSASGKFAETDTDECLKADKSQGHFRHIIDF